MFNAISEAFVDTIKMFPFMLVIFVMVEFFEHRYGSSLKPILKSSKSVGPIIGALLGILPQCGFSVMSTLLFAEGAITIGTLVAVYLATSDEAIPIILSEPHRAGVLAPLLIIKLIIAVLSGYIIDLFYKVIKGKNQNISCNEHIDGQYGKNNCCGHECTDSGYKLQDIFKHSFTHSFRVFLYVFAVSVIINVLLLYTGEENLSRVFMGDSIFQPVITSLIGMIPNCAASVAITEVFLNGGISFGSMVSGLSASAGLGLIVLFKEVKDKKRILFIILMLMFFSILSGIIINSFIHGNFTLPNNI